MTLIEAFVNQIFFAFFAVVVCYPQKDKFPPSFWESGIYIVLFMNFIFGTWLRWYYQLPIVGAVGYLFQ
jgi:hypothetical protein